MDGPPSATLSTSADSFSIAFDPGVDDGAFQRPVDPPAVGRTAERLGFDVYISTTEDGGCTYAFRGVESA